MKTSRWIAIAGVVATTAGVPAALHASGERAAANARLTAALTPREVVRKPVFKKRFRIPTGRFTATLVNPTAERPTLRWRLTYTKLTAMAFSAHIHRGKPRRIGAIIINLCGPCRTGQRGSLRISKYAAKSIMTRTAYVEVHTKENLKGELRGQIKLG